MKKNPSQPEAAGSACRAYASLLPLLRAGELTQEQEATLRMHLDSCARCQRELAAYDTLDAATRRQFGEMKAPLFASMEELIEHARAGDQAPDFAEAAPLSLPAAPTAPAPPARRRPRRLYTWISAVAVVLVIAFTLAGLIISHPPAIGKRMTSIPSAPLSVYIMPTSDQTTDTELIALNAGDGTVRWRSKIGVAEVAPILNNGVLYVAATTGYGTNSSQGHVSAFRASDGLLLWQQQMLPEVGKLVVNAGIVYASSGQAQQAYTCAFRASDGSLLWRFDQGILRAVADGMAYIGAYPSISKDAPLYAVNASDGSIQWQRPGNGPNTYTIWYAYPAGGILYVIAGSISYGGILPITLVALNPRTGKQLWSHPSLGWFIAAEPGVAVAAGRWEGSAAFPLPPSEVYGLNAADGSIKWHLQLPSPVRINGGVPGNGVFYLGATNKTLSAIDTSTGSTLWQAPLTANIAPSLVANGLIVLSANQYALDALDWPSGRLEARDARDGSVKWVYQSSTTTDRVDAKALTNGLLYIDTVDQSDPNAPGDPVTGNSQQHAVLSALNVKDGSVKWSYDLETNRYEYLTVG